MDDDEIYYSKDDDLEIIFYDTCADSFSLNSFIKVYKTHAYFLLRFDIDPDIQISDIYKK